jgi:hypothetical protein
MLPLTHSGGRHEVAKAAIECHGWSDHNALDPLICPKAVEHIKYGRLFRSHIQIMNARPDRSLDDWNGCIDKRARAIEHCAAAGDRMVEGNRILYIRNAHFGSGTLRGFQE